MSITNDIVALGDIRRAGRLIPFVGAGLSVPFKLPSYSKLMDIIAKQLDFDPEVFKLSGTRLQLAEYYVVTKGSIGPLRSEMDRLFNPKDDKIKASRSHQALVNMKVPIIYTTNYDRIIETAFKLRNVSCHVISSIDDIATAPLNTTQIVKFHGSFDNDASLVLTESSYFDRLEFRSALDIKLQADMLGKCLLFLGYGLDDINVRYMLYKLHKLRDLGRHDDANRIPSAYWITFGVSEIQRALLYQWDVRVVELDPVHKTPSMAHFLESLL
jgi:hypothetical protein